MKKLKVVKIWQTTLGVVTELTMALFIMAVALGLSWLLVRGIQ